MPIVVNPSNQPVRVQYLVPPSNRVVTIRLEPNKSRDIPHFLTPASLQMLRAVGGGYASVIDTPAAPPAAGFPDNTLRAAITQVLQTEFGFTIPVARTFEQWMQQITSRPGQQQLLQQQLNVPSTDDLIAAIKIGATPVLRITPKLQEPGLTGWNIQAVALEDVGPAPAFLELQDSGIRALTLAGPETLREFTVGATARPLTVWADRGRDYALSIGVSSEALLKDVVTVTYFGKSIVGCTNLRINRVQKQEGVEPATSQTQQRTFVFTNCSFEDIPGTTAAFETPTIDEPEAGDMNGSYTFNTCTGPTANFVDWMIEQLANGGGSMSAKFIFFVNCGTRTSASDAYVAAFALLGVTVSVSNGGGGGPPP